MKSKDIMVTLISVACIAGGYAICVLVKDYLYDSREKDLFQQQQIAQQSLNNKIVDLLREKINSNEEIKAIVHTADWSIQGASEQIVKTAGNATRITIGQKVYEEEQIKEIQTPSKRNSGKTEDFTINNTIIMGLSLNDEG